MSQILKAVTNISNSFIQLSVVTCVVFLGQQQNRLFPSSYGPWWLKQCSPLFPACFSVLHWELSLYTLWYSFRSETITSWPKCMAFSTGVFPHLIDNTKQHGGNRYVVSDAWMRWISFLITFDGYLSFMLGFTLQLSVRKITASTWPERQNPLFEISLIFVWLLRMLGMRALMINCHLLQQRCGAPCDSRSLAAPCSQLKGRIWGGQKAGGSVLKC